MILVRLSTWDGDRVREIAAAHGLTVESSLGRVRVFRAAADDEAAACAAVAQEPDVEAAQIEVPLPRSRYGTVTTTGLIPNDSLLDRQWFLKRLNCYRAWKLLGGYGSQAITLGISDSNTDLSAHDFDNITEPLITETFTVDASGQVALAHAPDIVAAPYGPTAQPVVTVGGQARTRVTTAPGAGQYQCVRASDLYGNSGGSDPADCTNVLQFSAADVGLTGQASYYDRRLISNDVWNVNTNHPDTTNSSRKDTLEGYGSTGPLGPGYEEHGTGCLGVAVANTNNGQGAAGVAGGLRVVYFADNGVVPSAYDTAAQTFWLYDHGARIISISTWIANNYTANPFYGNAGVIAAGNALQWLAQNGVLIFGAAANDNKLLPSTVSTVSGSPSSYVLSNLPGVIGVGAIDETDARWTINGTYASNYGALIPFCAPGRNLLCPMIAEDASYNVTSDGAGWHGGWFGHTSAATPITAAVAGLVWSANPSLTAAQVLDVMLTTGDASFDAGFAAKFPNAVIPNAGKAVAKALAMASPGSVQLAPSFWTTDGYTAPAELIDLSNGGAPLGAPVTATIGTGPWSTTTVSGGAATTTLSGSVVLDIAAYAADGSTPTVTVNLGGTTIYSGPPRTLRCGASASGTVQPLTVSAMDASGNTTEETYTDISVASLQWLDAPPPPPKGRLYFGATKASLNESNGSLYRETPLKVSDGTQFNQ